MILGILIAFILIPQVASIWWNPFSWFKKILNHLGQTVQVQEENPNDNKKRVVDNKVSGKKIVTRRLITFKKNHKESVLYCLFSCFLTIITFPPDLCKNVGAQSSYIPGCIEKRW